MKVLKSVLLCTFVFAISANAYEGQSVWTSNYVGYSFDFVAPVVSSTSDVSDKQTGLIVFDASDSTYKGYGASSGTWYSLGGANAGPRSMVQVDSGNGYGSTNDKVRRFSATRANLGSDITYADSATDGASFTVATDGVYAVTYMDRYVGGGEQLCITVNATATTTSCGTPISYAQGLRAIGNAITNGAGNISWKAF